MIGTVRGMMRSKKEVAGLPAPIASFRSNASGVKLDSLKVLVEAQQDLHGYDKPWAGGGGKNLLNDTTGTHTINANTDKTEIIGDVYLEANTTYTISCKQTPAPLTSFVRNIFVVVGGGTATYNPAGNDYTIKPMTFTPTVSDTYSIRVWGNTLSANTTYSEFQVEKGSTPTSYAPYENICPITGWSGANVTRTGKNLFDNASPILGRYLNDIGGQILGSGWNISDYIPIKGGQTYHFKPNSTLGGSAYGYFYTADSVASTIAESRFRSGEITITAPSEARYVRFSYRDTSSDIQLELGSTATAYEPYNGNTYTIQFGDTYYGCELDVTNGVLRVIHGYIEFDGTENWINVGGSYPFAFQIDTGVSNKVDNPISAQGITTNLFPQATTDVPTSNAIRWQVGGWFQRPC